MQVSPLDEVTGHEDAVRPAFAIHSSGVLGVGLLLGQVADRDVGALRAKAMATARPMPESPPVMRALRPSSLPWPT